MCYDKDTPGWQIFKLSAPKSTLRLMKKLVAARKKAIAKKRKLDAERKSKKP